MERDLRQTPLYQQIEAFLRNALEPGFGTITDASDPQPSPDGRTVAFTGSRLEALEGEPASRICLVGVEDGMFRQVTNGPNDDSHARWSPDGTRLTFQSDRETKGCKQLYVLEAGALGEAVRLPEVLGTIEYHAWSPDGSKILLGVAGLGADQAGASGSGTIRTSEDLPSWVPAVESPENVDREWRRLWLLDVAGGTVAPLTHEGTNVWEAAWCGTDAVLAIVSQSPGEEAWYAASLALIDTTTGKERTLAKSDVQLALPAARPDGSRAAIVEAVCSDRMIVAGDVLLLDVTSGDARRVDTAGVDVTWLDWRLPDRLFFMGLRGMASVAGEIDAATGAVTEFRSWNEGSGDWYPSGAPLAAGSFATVLHSSSRPPEVVVADGEGERTIASTANDGTAFLLGVLPRRDRVTWTAPDGLEVEGLLAAPAGDGPHPLVVFVHGGPVWAYQDTWPRTMVPLFVSRGYAVFQPNPRGSTGHGQKFAGMVVGDMGGDDALDVLSGIDALVARGVADPDRIGVTGGSYGGFMSCWLPVRDQRFKAAVAVSPVTDWYSQHFNSNIGHWDADFLKDLPERPGGEYHDRSPVLFADRVTTPTLLTAGLNDRCTPPGQAIEFYRALRWRGVETEVVIYPEEGHGVRNFPALIDLLTRTVAWFERFMPAGPAPG
jgi:dipeptidyl aminopeptidase/acylaminoacyl peptidase